MTRKWANTSLDYQEDQGSYPSFGVFQGLDTFIETKIAQVVLGKNIFNWFVAQKITQQEFNTSKLGNYAKRNALAFVLLF